MPLIPRLVLTVIVALLIGGGVMAYDRSHGAGWLVSPEQIATAKASGKAGYEDGSGSVTVLPIRSETASLLPLKWLLLSLAGGALCFVATRPRVRRP